MNIKKWSEISSEYKGSSLIIGNGASIAFDKVFDYRSLYQVSEKHNLIDLKLKNLFQKFKTKNYELVLYRLWQAGEVLNALGENSDSINDNYSLCREALIKTVHKAHIKYDKDCQSFIEKLDKSSMFLMDFKTVFSLNYDLILYWVIAWGNNHSDRRGNIFKDGFIESLTGLDFKSFKSDLAFLRKPHQEQDIAILIFYPHGNLTLARFKLEQFHEIDLKLCSPGQQHLDAIFNNWQGGQFEPVFISEGDPHEKKKRILESEYLRTTYKYGFDQIEQLLVIYGWSISKQDNHLLEKLINIQVERKKNGEDPIKRIAVSVYPNGEEQKFIDHIEEKLKPITNAIDFYDSNEGCWCF